MKKAGLIGLGTITKNYKPGLEKSGSIGLCAVCDRTKEASSVKYYEEYPFYADYRELIQKERPDLVIISTPPALHYDMAHYALERGVGVLVEKPATISMEDYLRLFALAKEENLPFVF